MFIGLRMVLIKHKVLIANYFMNFGREEVLDSYLLDFVCLDLAKNTGEKNLTTKIFIIGSNALLNLI